jgi:5-oxoprolinase (ATP-hydrolysing)
LRYAGTDSFLPVAMAGHDAVLAAFTEAHRARFGFATPERQVVVEAALAEVTMPGEAVTEATLAPRPAGKAPPELGRVRLFCAGAHHDAPVLDREALLAGDHISGPALIREAIATTVIEPGWTGEVTSLNHLILRRTEPRAAARAAETGAVDPVMLELFNSLFMSIAEQTGVVLQNTSLSVNIKERWTSPAPSSTPRGTWSPTRRTCRSTWAPWARA